MRKQYLYYRFYFVLSLSLCTSLIAFEQASWRVAHPLNIAVIGTGYVGLVTGTCLASCGHKVMCVDNNSAKINLLNAGHITLYEPGLEPLLHESRDAQRLLFTNDAAHAIQESSIIFIAVGTPCLPSGHADLSAVMAVINVIVNNLNNFKIICLKSTVPIGTANILIKALSTRGITPDRYALISNPEFLREGSAIHDFFNPDRIIIGLYPDNERIRTMISQLYEPFIARDIPLLYTDHTSAEAIKYAANSFLATKISLINEIANLCDVVGADVFAVAQGIGLDKRIGTSFLRPGPGFGGSCFPKDCLALLTTAHDSNIPLPTIAGALATNEHQQQKPVEKLKKLLGKPLQGLTIGILGLAFKANTDDIRCSPAITTLSLLLEEECVIKAYDPAAIAPMKELFPTIRYCNSITEAVTDVDACIIMTEWDEFRVFPLETLKILMRQPYVIDARNILNTHELKRLGFVFDTIGRSVCAR